MNTDPAASPAEIPPSTREHVGSIIAILAGAALCLLPAAMFGTALGTYPTRMVCTQATGYGSGCYEGDLMSTFFVFGFVFLFCTAFCFALTKAYRYNLPKGRRWLPFQVFCCIVLMTVAVFAFTMGTEPGQPSSGPGLQHSFDSGRAAAVATTSALFR